MRSRDRLKARAEALVARQGRGIAVPAVQMAVGEDPQLVCDAAELDGDELILVRVFGRYPRIDMVTPDSLRDALPGLKFYFIQRGDDQGRWFRLAQAFGIDYDAIEPRQAEA